MGAGCTKDAKGGVIDLQNGNVPATPRSPAKTNVKTEGPARVDLPGAVVEDEISDRDSPGAGSLSTPSPPQTAAAKQNGTKEKHLAFEVPGEPQESLVRRHPPLRFRKLEDQQVELSQEMINLKQAEAEKRRSAFMTQRAKSARASSAARMRSTPSAGRVYTGPIESAIEGHVESYSEETHVI